MNKRDTPLVQETPSHVHLPHGWKAVMLRDILMAKEGPRQRDSDVVVEERGEYGDR